MKDFQNLYETSCEHSYDEGLLRFFFVSEVELNIVKTVEYQFVGYFEGRPLFNLAFGDLNVDDGSVSDSGVSNNGDTFKIFHTVLNTVPAFFKSFGDVKLMVRGSDSKPEFIATCRAACLRRCGCY